MDALERLPQGRGDPKKAGGPFVPSPSRERVRVRVRAALFRERVRVRVAHTLK
jgi:hypothetical protein